MRPIKNWRKGLALSLNLLFVLVVIMLAFVFLYSLFIGRFLDIKVIVQESTLERHTINIANIVMASPKLAYVDGVGGLHKGVVEKMKIDGVMIKEDEADGAKLNSQFNENELLAETSYPTGLYILHIKDLKTNNAWIAVGHGPFDGEGIDSMELAGCVSKNLPFETLNQIKCLDKYKSKPGISHKQFPVNLMIDANEIHPAVLTIITTEMEVDLINIPGEVL